MSRLPRSANLLQIPVVLPHPFHNKTKGQSGRGQRSPKSIGLSIVELIGTEKNILRVKNIDVLDGTPLLDIKPYVPGFDNRKVHNIGWMEKKINNLAEARDDGRFAE